MIDVRAISNAMRELGHSDADTLALICKLQDADRDNRREKERAKKARYRASGKPLENNDRVHDVHDVPVDTVDIPSPPFSPSSSSPPIPPLITTPPKSPSSSLVNADAIDGSLSDFKKVKRIRDEKNTELIQTVASNWNDFAAELKLPQVVHITPARQSSILRRAKELVEYYDYPDAILGFRALFAKIRGSPFLRGETGKFRADLDFAINQSSFTKIMEDRYESVKKREVTFRR